MIAFTIIAFVIVHCVCWRIHDSVYLEWLGFEPMELPGDLTMEGKRMAMWEDNAAASHTKFLNNLEELNK